MSQTVFTIKRSYLQEAAGLGIFMFLACLGDAALEAPPSALHRALGDPALRRALMGLLMGLTAFCLIRSPMGRSSGAHYNPAVTFCFWRLNKIGGRDALAYAASHFVGGLLGVVAAWACLGRWLAVPEVRFIVTVPGPPGAGVAFAAEFCQTFVLMSAILLCIYHERVRPYVAAVAALILALEVALFSPLSGTSLNPARTLASAIPAGDYRACWVYFTAPLLGMALPTEIAFRVLEWERHHGIGL